ncbi:hypothetical protein ABF87_10205 [Nitrosomonas sp. JL21]|uniref:hypothetical protein n=1 Tax=Nitrosomonas sp. JL21 TaxID=153949 RepID=UPI0013718486|nr:hypothetical protein [Nitrosomonas sp. JL21]MCC7090688.1 hypothetical protein [Nitrosomonas sp.]MXS78323.1 hypothetical protein [Nitrosomonas sp. JL21]
MNISKQIIVSVWVIASMGFSVSIFSADGPPALTGEIADKLLDRADQVKKGDMDARRISEELGKPNPGDLEEHVPDDVNNSIDESVEEKEPEADPALKTTPE